MKSLQEKQRSRIRMRRMIEVFLPVVVASLGIFLGYLFMSSGKGGRLLPKSRTPAAEHPAPLSFASEFHKTSEMDSQELDLSSAFVRLEPGTSVEVNSVPRRDGANLTLSNGKILVRVKDIGTDTYFRIETNMGNVTASEGSVLSVECLGRIMYGVEVSALGGNVTLTNGYGASLPIPPGRRGKIVDGQEAPLLVQ